MKGYRGRMRKGWREGSKERGRARENGDLGKEESNHENEEKGKTVN
ncbi:hypothetical protein QE422_003874 [Chryseobacterium sp. SORGH_AS 447]|nr:hypothetical protein [Chryseobacterium sp. SORGH_AS_0447]MDQ1163361.1 hypothetical protein [Chryseobacterium sp. SORGH_AS_0447]MDQ1163506.1 hypothetical protein [Chryseobacterium sp. SORGH_AS_0447]